MLTMFSAKVIDLEHLAQTKLYLINDVDVLDQIDKCPKFDLFKVHVFKSKFLTLSH